MASRDKVRRIARGKARDYGIDQNVFDRQINLESGFNDRAVSSAGARGAGQLMPGTARALGVRDVNDARQNLDGAARYLKQQLDANHGNYREALAAYNAGPGNKRAGYGYADKILNGKNPKAPKGGGSTSSTGSRSTPDRTVTLPGQDNSSLRKQIVLDYVQRNQPTQKDPYGAAQSGRTVQLVAAIRGAQDGPTSKVTVPGTRAARRSSGGGGKGGRATVLEDFYNGPGGANVKNGKSVPKGFVSGHTDHVHAAFGSSAEAVRWGKIAQGMGLHVGEHSHFGGVHPVHVKNSNHYKDLAIDVSGPPAKMAAFSRKVARARGGG